MLGSERNILQKLRKRLDTPDIEGTRLWIVPALDQNHEEWWKALIGFR
jgi:hypothetical protein